MSPKRGAYPREFRDDAVRMLRAGRDPVELGRELGVTPTTLRVWLYRAEGGVHGPNRTREDVIAQTVDAYERLDRVLDTVPKRDLAKPMLFSADSIDPWRVKDAVAHVTHYKARVVHRLTKDWPDDYWASEAWDELESSDRTLATMDARTRRRHGRNHLVYVRWRDASIDEVLAWHRRVHKHVVSTLAKGPETWFSTEARRGSPRLSNEAVAALGVHSDQHLRDIRRALDMR